MEDVAWTIKYASQASVAIPMLALFRLREFKNTLTANLTILLVASFISDTLSSIEGARGNSNLYIGNTYHVVQFLLLSAIYSHLLTNRKRTTYLSSVGFLLYFVVITFYFQEITVFQSMVRLVAGTILIIYSSLYWYQLYVTQPTPELRYYPQFWFNAAIFAYFSFNLFLFTIFSYLTELSNDAALAIWIWHNLNNIAKNVLFAMAIFYLKR
jgi:hypothetical protein